MDPQVEEFLAHYGVKGMKWGVRHDPTASGTTVFTNKRGKVAGVQLSRARQERGPSDDAARAAITRKTAKERSTDALSNKELQELVTRMNLEQQYDRLRPKSGGEKVSKFITDTLIGVGKDQAGKLARDQVAEALKKK